MKRISMFVQEWFDSGKIVLLLGCSCFLLSKRFRELCCRIKVQSDITSETIDHNITSHTRRVNIFFRRHNRIRNSGFIAGGFCAALVVTGMSMPNVIIVSSSHPKESIAVKTNTKTRYTKEEKQLMVLAYKVGRELAGAPETIQAILLVETYAGRHGDRVGDRHLPIGRRSYGVMQVKADTARKVLRSYPRMAAKYFEGRHLDEVTDEEIIAKLLGDDEFCIRIGTLNFVLERRLADNDWTKGVVAYNTGSVGLKSVVNPDTFVYTQKIKQKIAHEIKPFNKEMGLGI